MAIIPVTADDVELFTIVTTPNRFYSSSSLGITGSVKVFPRQSHLEKDTTKSLIFNDTAGNVIVDSNFDSLSKNIKDHARTIREIGQPITSDVGQYFNLVSGSLTKTRDVLDIERFTPTTRITKRTISKNNVKDMLMPFYRVDYPHAHWAYTNYNSLNFFTANSGSTQLIPTSSVLLYPNEQDSDLPGQEGYVSGSYCLTGAFSFDFYINPRYKEDGITNGHFKAGTIFHLSSSYALSLVTGSLKDVNGKPEGFRLQLQLSQSANIAPTFAKPDVYPNDLVFLSSDNSLNYNNWHHVVVRWGTSAINRGTGSFMIDGINRGNFVVPSGTIMPRPPSDSLNPDVLCVGNFYEGSNYGVDAMSIFFSPNNARRDGVDQLTTVEADIGYYEPVSYKFKHPLKAEIHDLTFRRYFMSDAESSATGSRGIGLDAINKKNIAFYLPPFFVQDTTIKRWVADHGGILQTPFFEIDGTTDDPFNVAMAFGVNGHYINLDNFVKDFSTGRFPRLLNLTASAIDHTTAAEEANSFLYLDGGVAKRNLTILPCDDGMFDPNYEILTTERLTNKYTDSQGNIDLSYINLDNLVTTASLMSVGVPVTDPQTSATRMLYGLDPDNPTTEAFTAALVGFSPENPGMEPGDIYKTYIAAVTESLGSVTDDFFFDRGVQRGVPLTIYQRTLDPSSNQVTFFNISNLYYGRRIQPGTFELKDVGISGSRGSVKITLRDDKLGNLYRADSLTPHATQNSVGNIFYDEGIIVVKSPHLYFIGKSQYEISFKGVHNIYSTKYEILANAGSHNSSSNSSFATAEKSIKPSGEAIDNEPFVYISGINLHDENMNVIAKAKLVQPIIKRESNSILFKVALDF